MAEHPEEPVIYSGLPSFSALMVHEYDDAGALKFVRGVPIPKGFLVCWAKVTADGRFLYVSNTGNHTIAVFDVADPRNPKHLQSHPLPGPGGVGNIYLDEENKTIFALDHFDPLGMQPGDSNRLHAFKIGDDGRLSGGAEGEPQISRGRRRHSDRYGVAPSVMAHRRTRRRLGAAIACRCVAAALASPDVAMTTTSEPAHPARPRSPRRASARTSSMTLRRLATRTPRGVPPGATSTRANALRRRIRAPAERGRPGVQRPARKGRRRHRVRERGAGR